MWIFKYLLIALKAVGICIAGIIGLLIVFCLIGLVAGVIYWKIDSIKEERERKEDSVRQYYYGEYDTARQNRINLERKLAETFQNRMSELQDAVESEAGALHRYLQFMADKELSDMYLERELDALLERIPA